MEAWLSIVATVTSISGVSVSFYTWIGKQTFLSIMMYKWKIRFSSFIVWIKLYFQCVNEFVINFKVNDESIQWLMLRHGWCINVMYVEWNSNLCNRLVVRQTKSRKLIRYNKGYRSDIINRRGKIHAPQVLLWVDKMINYQKLSTTKVIAFRKYFIYRLSQNST